MTKNGGSLVATNRMCLDFGNLPFTAGDPLVHAVSWAELVEFLAVKQIVSRARAGELESLPETDGFAANNLLHVAKRLGEGIRFAAKAMIRGSRIHREWIDPLNQILRITEGHDELEWDGAAWRMGFFAKHEGLEWLLAAVARSAAELIAAGAKSGVRKCANPNCQLLFCDDSRTRRRRWCSMALCGNRSKVAAFARRRGAGGVQARSQHA